VKIDSKQNDHYANKFDQQGYPLTLVLNGVGGEIERFSGRQHVATLAYKLDQILAKGRKG
jgi:cobalamin biosynthesis Co2+ chelatase CbiK